jgi:hypothetical protein
MGNFSANQLGEFRTHRGDVPSNNQIGFVMAFGVLMDAGRNGDGITTSSH